MVNVMVLAAGYGSRLRPLTDRIPKPLVPVGDRPMLTHLLDGLHSELGDIELFINAHYRAELLTDYVRRHYPTARVLVESTLLGTAGGLRAAWPLFRRERVLIVNADILARPDYARLMNSARDARCCLCLSRRAGGEGNVGVSADGRIVRMRGEVFGLEATGGDYMGIAALGATAGETLPESGCLVGDWLLALLRRGESVGAHFDETEWSDIGGLGAYAAANWRWLTERRLRSWVAPDAVVPATARLTDVIVGPGAVITMPGAFERVIVWPQARVNEVVNDCVVTSDGRIVPLVG